jgi:hypothetical protein
MAKKTEAQKEKARQYSRDWYARQQREKREAAADAKSADPIKAAAKRLSKWADEELSIRLSPKHENKAAKAATALTVAGQLETMTYAEMHELVRLLWAEVKRRNPIGVNVYTGLLHAAFDLKEISAAEALHFTSEHGPREPKQRKRRA